jgi:hypothetical protein
MLPNLIIAGVNKAGTTSLFTWLSQHPDVCASDVKETCYFMYTFDGDPEPPLSVYQSHFCRWAGQPVILEATPGYFYGGQVTAESIRRRLGPIRILICLRDPVDRMISAYRANQSMLAVDGSADFESYLNWATRIPTDDVRHVPDTLAGGCYARYLPAWLDAFDDHAKVVFFESLKTNPSALLAEICSWLDIAPLAVSSGVLTVENRSRNYNVRLLHASARWINRVGERFWRTHPVLKKRIRSVYYRLNEAPFAGTVSAPARDALCTYYRPFNKQLADLLTQHGYRDLPAWVAMQR